MKLSAKEQNQVRKLLKEERRPGMVIWMENRNDGDSYPNGYCQGDPYDMIMMSAHAVDLAANAFGLPPELMAEGLMKLFASGKYKQGNISGEFRPVK